MNHTYRLVWNEAGQCQVPAPETARGRGKRSAAKPLAAALLAAFTFNAQALPTGAQVVAGQVGVTTAGKQMTLEQASQAAIVNWQGFNVARDEALRIHQNDGNAAMLARVVGNAGSEILGRIQADGRLYLVNQRGVIIGKDAVIDTAAFMAATRNISDADFLRGGPLTFSGDSMAGIENLGMVRAAEGNVMLFAHAVSNSGSLQAPNGAANLAAGNEVLLASADAPDFLVRAILPGAGTRIDNTGLIEAAQVKLQAAGGSMYELAINQAGAIRATGVEEHNGRVILTAEGAALQVSGTVSAHNANGGGGEILVGGDMRGANPDVSNAANALVTSTAVLEANSTAANGNGGKVVVWSDSTTQFSGAIAARGGLQGGNGGSAEVSGKRNLVFRGTADLQAPNGARGTLLLDPDSIAIVADDSVNATPTSIVDAGGTWIWPTISDSGTAQTITSTVVQNLLGTGNLSLNAANNISVNSAIGSSSTNSFSLMANQIAVNAGISLPNGALAFYTPESSGFATGISVSSAVNAPITAHQFQVDQFATIALAGAVTTPALALTQGAGITSFSATNAANNIASLSVSNFASPYIYDLTGNFDIASASAMSINAKINAGGLIRIVSGGNLTMRVGSALTATGATTLASTGGAFINQTGAGLFAGAGRKLIYTSTDANGFTDGGLGYTQVNPVSYGSDPQGTGNVIYVQTASGLPLMIIAANSASRFYGQADPTFSAALNGGQLSDLNSPILYSILEGSDTNAGSYTIVPYGPTSSTHRLSFVNSTLTVNKAPLTITASNASKLYGDFNPGFSMPLSGYSGFVNGDTPYMVSGLQISTPATVDSPVGSYAIVPSGASAANYAIGYVNGTLTVNKAPLTITAPNVSRLYGDPNVFGAAQYYGLRNSDTAAVVSGLQLNTSATTASPVGNYAIIPTAGAASNYAISYANGTLAIDKAPLYISINDAMREEFQANPPFSATFGGLKNGDSASVLTGLQLDTNATSSSPPGQYSISPSALGTAANYTPQVQKNGSLTLNPSSQKSVVLYTRDARPSVNVDSLFTDHSVKTSVATLFMGTSNPALVKEQNRLLDQFSAALAKAGATLSADQINLALANPATHDYMMGTLLPYLYQELANILDIAPANWSPEQQAYVTTLANYIHDQKVAAANKSQADYKAWEEAQYQKHEATMALGGATGATLDMINSSNPELPPPEILLQAQNGVVMTIDQLKSYASQTAVVADLGKRADAAKAAAEADIANLELARLPGLIGDFYNHKINDSNRQAYLSASQKYGQARERLKYSSDPAVIAQARQDLADAYKVLGGPEITVKDLPSVAAPPGYATTSATQNSGHDLGYLAGSIADAGRLIITGLALSAELDGAQTLLGKISPSLKKEVFPFAEKVEKRLNAKEKMSDWNINQELKEKNLSEGTKTTEGLTDGSKTVSESTKITEGVNDGAKTLSESTKITEGIDESAKIVNEGAKTLESISKISKIVETAGEALGPIGVVLDIVGNLIQIGVGGAEYAQIGQYKNALDKAAQDAKKQITVDDLKAMKSSGVLFNYLNVMTSSNGKVGDQ